MVALSDRGLTKPCILSSRSTPSIAGSAPGQTCVSEFSITRCRPRATASSTARFIVRTKPKFAALVSTLQAMPPIAAASRARASASAG